MPSRRPSVCCRGSLSGNRGASYEGVFAARRSTSRLTRERSLRRKVETSTTASLVKLGKYILNSLTPNNDWSSGYLAGKQYRVIGAVQCLLVQRPRLGEISHDIAALAAPVLSSKIDHGTDVTVVGRRRQAVERLCKLLGRVRFAAKNPMCHLVLCVWQTLVGGALDPADGCRKIFTQLTATRHR